MHKVRSAVAKWLKRASWGVWIALVIAMYHWRLPEESFFWGPPGSRLQYWTFGAVNSVAIASVAFYRLRTRAPEETWWSSLLSTAVSMAVLLAVAYAIWIST